MLKVGLVGLPNVGKSTIFNAMSRAGAKCSNYSFCTVEPNHGVALVPDARLETLGRIFHQQKIVPAHIEFVDIAGLVKGASKGEGLGNQFLHHIREVDAILHIVRCFENTQIAHVEDTLDPVRDVEIVNLELLLADLGRVEKRREEIAPKVRMGAAEVIKVNELLKKLSASLGSGKPAKAAPFSKEEWAELEDINLLTQKPVLYLANIGEEEARCGAPNGAWAKLEAHLLARGEMLVAMAGKAESDLAELEEPERAQFAAEMGFTSSVNELIHACYKLLSLITFFTGVGAEVRSWPIPAGSSAREAAGKIHTDIAKGFIRAEVIGFDELATIGSWETAKSKGLVRQEGKEYLLREGDVCYFRFST